MNKTKLENTESQIRLTFYLPRRTPISILASPNAQLGDAIQATGLTNFSFEDHITFAEVNDRPDEVAVVPGILCRELKPNGKVRAKPRKGATPLPKSEEGKDLGDVNKENTVPTTQQILFYVDSTKPGITKKPIPHTAYEGKLICVIARDGDKLGDAISRDGRISDRIMLLEDNDRQAEVPLHYQVSKFSRQTFIMKKQAPKRKKADSQLSEKQNENESVFSSIPDNLNYPFTEEIGRAMINNARQNALETFAKPGVNGDTDHHIKKMVQEFGKKTSSAIPTRILDTLAIAKKSVGYIHCGDYAGTCFLLTENSIITSRHIINQIVALRSEATDKERYRTIFVDFDYEDTERHRECVAEVDEEGETLSGQGNMDYAICVLKPSERNHLEPLGPLVRSPLPRSGRVIIVGHPEKQYKSLEICRIIPGYNWHATLNKRALEAKHYCERNTGECSLNVDCQMDVNEIVECIHMYEGRYLDPAKHNDQLPYDTSFFHGASGSPVFNTDGHIIAMHTMGYPFYQSSKEVSLMEFGITFGAIFRDVKRQYGDEVANHLFPTCQD